MTTQQQDHTPERAAEVLKPIDGFLWHSGGGVNLARVNFSDDVYDGPHVLVSDAQDTLGSETPPGWYVGFYRGDGDDQVGAIVAREPEQLVSAVKGYRDGWRVQIKHEDEEGGQAIGPLFIYRSVDPADDVDHSPLVGGGFGVLFHMDRDNWITESQARAIAEQIGGAGSKVEVI